MIFKKILLLFKRFWGLIKRPFAKGTAKLRSMNRKNLIVLLLGCVVVLCAFTGVALKVTSTPQFCSSCHEMSPEYTTWENSSHAKIACVQCHIEPGFINLVSHKMNSLEQLYLHLTGGVPKTIVMNEPIKNDVCEQCHSTVRQVTPSGDILIPHDKHLAQGISCVACHAGVVHGFITERGLTEADKGRADWTADKAKQAVNFTDTKLTMEVCLNCHEQVNQGKKPWLENEGQGQTEQQRVDEQKQIQQIAATATGKLTEPTPTTTTNNTGLHPPVLQCDECHSAIKTPPSHQTDSWKTTHGITARQDVTYCASCHSREKERAAVTKDTNVADYARSNSFCASCHATRPASHLQSEEQWLPTHPSVIQKQGGADGCLTCHDISKPSPKPQTTDQLPGEALPSPNPVYCNECHWFKNGKIN